MQARQGVRTGNIVAAPGVSWVDRWAGWMESLPGPPALSYLVLAALLVAAMQAVFWVNSVGPYPALDLRDTWPAPLPILAMLAYHTLVYNAGTYLDAYRPALAIDEMAYARLRRNFTRLSPVSALACLGAAVVLFGLLMWQLPHATLQAFAATRERLWLFYGPFFFANLVFGTLGVYASIRQAVLVSRLFGMAEYFDLAEPEPLHALARYTTNLAIALMLFSCYLLATQLAVGDRNPVAVAFVFFTPLAAVATFVMPLLGMHVRMEREKERLLSGTKQRWDVLITDLHEHVDSRKIEGMTEIRHALESVGLEREQVTHLPTWPAATSNLVRLASGLLSPVVVYLINEAVQRIKLP